MHQMLSDNVFRAGVGAVILNQDGLVLAGERHDHPGAWQLPQGGLRPGEEPFAGVLREIEEETGLAPVQLTLLAVYPEWLVYELPPERRTPKHGRGQVQQWYYLRLQPSATVDLARAVSREFVAVRWLSLTELAETTAPFRRSLYRKLAVRLAAFGD